MLRCATPLTSSCQKRGPPLSRHTSTYSQDTPLLYHTSNCKHTVTLWLYPCVHCSAPAAWRFHVSTLMHCLTSPCITSSTSRTYPSSIPTNMCCLGRRNHTMHRLVDLTVVLSCVASVPDQAWHKCMLDHSSCKLLKCIPIAEPPAACEFCCSRPALIFAMRRMRSIAAMRLQPAMLSLIRIGNRNSADTASCVSCDAPQIDSFNGCAPSLLRDLHAVHCVPAKALA
jgi:hypothetical protein